MQRLFLLFAFLPSLVFSASNIKVALSSMPSNMNPFHSTDANSQNINRLVYRSLIDFDRDMKPFCDACESFENIVTEKGEQSIHFVLKAGLKFHDNSPLLTEDVENSIKYFKDKKISSVFQNVFSKIIDFKKKSNREFTIVYDQFDYDNLGNLSLLRLFKIKSNYQRDFHPDQYIGSGDYWFTVFEPNKVVIESLKAEKKIFTFKVVRDETTAALKIMNQEVDISIANMSPRKIKWLKQNAGGDLDITVADGSNYVYLNLNHENSLLKKIEVRKALASSLPIDEIIKYRLNGFADKANSIFSPSFVEYYRPVKTISKNLEYAESQLVSVGAIKKGGKYYLDGKAIEFDLLISSNKNTFETAKIIQHELSKTGITINLVTLEWGTFMRRYKAGLFDLVLGQWVGFTGPGILNYIFHSESLPPNGGNRGRYVNKKFEDLYTKSLLTGDREARSQLIKTAVDTVFNDVAYISLWHPKVVWMKKKCIKNLRPFSNGSFLALKEVENQCQN